LIAAALFACIGACTMYIRVNAVAPGPILTDRLRQLPDDRRALVERAVPMGRVGLADEVASVVVWLASDAASFVTGTIVAIDRGRTAGA
jgi:NAD(P)-dependent dehydrogenase (short-subunit alcohol dehydrogenase family)